MRLFRISIPVLLLFFNCSQDVDVKTAEMQPLTDVLTFELSFGDENTIDKDEYLIAQPWGIAVSHEGDIVVSDEARLKIYDGNGTPKKIVGRYGQGPGEFRQYPDPIISNSGYMAALEGRPEPKEINLFSDEYIFIKRMNMRNYAKLKNLLNKDNATLTEVGNMILFSDNEIVYSVSTNSLYSSTSVYRNKYLVYDSSDTLIILAKYTAESTYRDISNLRKKGIGVPRPSLGGFYWAELPERKVVFTHPEHEQTDEKGNFTYSLTITSLDDFTSEKIVQKYVPVAIPGSIKKRHVTGLKTDGNYIFVFTIKENELGHILGEVFDATTKKRIRAAYFSFVPRVIKDGYAYKFNDWMENNKFPLVEKYKIDPEMYGK